MLCQPCEVSQDSFLEAAVDCWGPMHVIKPTKDPKCTQERTMRRMIGNWMTKALTQAGLDRVELHRDTCAFYRSEEGLCVIDGTLLVHAFFK